jgi:hypothetical protein
VLHDAIRTYHDLLTPTVAADSQAQMDHFQTQHGLMFGDRPLCTVLRPRLLTLAQYDLLRDRVSVLAGAFAKAQQAALADRAFRDQFRLTPEEEELVQHDPGFACAYPTSRLDAFYVSDQELFFTEYNSETPAGAGYNHALSAMFFGLPVMREFMRRYQVYSLPTHVGVQHALLDAYHQWSGRRERPLICILDWKEVPTYSEFVLFAEQFRSQGFECLIADPREVEYDGRHLYADGKPVDLIYKRVLISELLQRGGMGHPVVRAVRENRVCMVNPFRCKILFKKASFAVLTDERNAHLFSDGERSAIVAHIPWTRVMEERKTLVPAWNQGGALTNADLVPHVLKHKDRFVLKPNDDYGGKGIVLGWTVDQSAWEIAVTTALAEPYIVQQRVGLPREPFPNWVENQVVIVDRMLDTDPFLCYGQYMDGSLCRISTADLLNVTAGGGSTVPTFVIDKR